ncbi:MAG: DUF3443 family protein [Oligoflexia bacterium]|nr:DUF3443 family protein [Oligoflexia bacterium]
MSFSKFSSLFFAGACVSALASCGGGSSTQTTTNSCPAANTSCGSATGPSAIPTSSTANIPLYIADSSTTGQWNYTNEPLVSVTVCTPNHTSASQCQTISNVLLDTGSYGLRVFASAITNTNVRLAQQTVNVQGETMKVAECAQFGTGADWGAVKNADVLLGNQTASNIPIHVIDINYASVPSDCASLCPDTDPCTAGYNGILGVGPFAQDCGILCDSFTSDKTNPGFYYGCDSTGCYNAYSGNCGTDGTCMIQVTTQNQVANPVASFASGYNNGVSLTLPSVASTGASAVTGSMTLGIPSSTTAGGVYLADSSGMTDGNGVDMGTVFQGTTYGATNSANAIAFIDSGSNAYFFPLNAPMCSVNSSFYCPASTDSLSAVIEGYSGSPTYTNNFSIRNADSLFSTNYSAFSTVAGNATGMFDWGLPFFYGRTVYVGLDGTSATINSSSVTGPYWAF